jgi:hypothetical protein
MNDQIKLVHMAGARGSQYTPDWAVPLASDPEFGDIMVNVDASNRVAPPTYDKHFYAGDATSLATLDLDIAQDFGIASNLDDKLEKPILDILRGLDPRFSPVEVLSETDYCLLCHDRDKDSCSKGMREKDGGYKANAIGVPLEGCPLDEKIGEMQQLRADGDALGALAIVTIDNPMLPGTGHRICNDCMKACVFQKQEPVNIPQVETGVLHLEVRAVPDLDRLRPGPASRRVQCECVGAATEVQ